MPDIKAQTPDGNVHVFPDGTAPEVVDRVIKQYVTSKGTVDPLTKQTQAAAPQTSTQPFYQKPPEGTPHSSANPIEQAGQRLDTLGRREQHALKSPTPVTNASMVLSAPSLAAEALPNAVNAGEKFSNVAAAMEKIPVNLTKSKAAAENAAKVIDLGGKPSKIISDFTKAVGEGNTLSWEDARTLISNASSRSRLSELFEGQTGYARRAIGQFVGELGNEIKSAAQSAGQGEDYGEALKEYRNAMRISRALKASVAIGGTAALKAMTSAGANSAVKTMWSSLE